MRNPDVTAYVSELAPGRSDLQRMFGFVSSGDVGGLRGATFEVAEACSC